MTNKSPLRILFMGTPSFAVAPLQALCEHGYKPEAVYTQPDKVNRRGGKISFSPVKSYALKQNIPVFQPLTFKTEESLDQIRSLRPDLIVVIAYGRILPQAVLDIPTYGAVNIHASLLPEYRGAAPVQRAIIDEKKVTGVTLMKLDAGMDTGDMIAVKKVPISQSVTAGELLDELSAIGAEELLKILPDLSGALAKAVPQDGSRATYAEKLTKDMGRIDWKKPAETLHALARGMYPNPGTYTFFRGKRVKIHKTLLGKDAPEGTAPGTIVSLKDGILWIACGKGTLALSQLQPENHKQMDAADFINGYQVKVNDTFEN